MPATRIVTTVHRPKRPPKKRKAVAIETAIVRKAKPGNDNRPEPAQKFLGPNAKPAIVTTISRKRARLQRAEQPAEPDDDPEATARVRAFLDRMMRPR